MTQSDIQLVKYSWSVIERLDPVVAGGIFYKRLLETAPQLRPLFREPIPMQSKKLITMIGYVIHRLDKLDTILTDIQQLAQRHVRYGVKEEHYALVGATLLWTLEQALSELWTPEVKEAWVTCYQLLSSAMIDAVAENPQYA